MSKDILKEPATAIRNAGPIDEDAIVRRCQRWVLSSCAYPVDKILMVRERWMNPVDLIALGKTVTQ